MEEHELRSILAKNIKKYRNKRGWSQLLLSEKLDISANYLSSVETGKGWVSPLTLVKLAQIFDINVFELFMPPGTALTAHNKSENAQVKRFTRDLTLALDVHSAETANALKKLVAKISKEYFN
ncbi:MAG: helix-turn-helix domain-containing protein [Treponema sp.]|jgi:transcriptional regulator with XRE-family HTH domain|nr:helix-turn-helix domain-containing protein [Treponema sp.]